MENLKETDGFFSFVLSVRLPTHIKTASPGGILRPKIQTQAIHPHASQSYGGNETHFFLTLAETVVSEIATLTEREGEKL